MGVLDEMFPALERRMAGKPAGTLIDTQTLVDALTEAYPLPAGYAWVGVDDGTSHSTNLLHLETLSPEVPDDLLALKHRVLSDLRDGGSLSKCFWARAEGPTEKVEP